MRIELPKYLTEEEWARFLAVITSPRDRALFILMYWRGLRSSEPRLIARSDIDLSTGSATFNRVKGSRGGTYALQDDERAALTAWLADPKCSDVPFDLGRAQIFNLFKGYATAADLPAAKRHPHILKHSIATHLLDAGLDIPDVMDWLGHVDVKNTMIYAQVTNKRRQQAAEIIKQLRRPQITSAKRVLRAKKIKKETV